MRLFEAPLEGGALGSLLSLIFNTSLNLVASQGSFIPVSCFLFRLTDPTAPAEVTASASGR
jgi:hypothetical protein